MELAKLSLRLRPFEEYRSPSEKTPEFSDAILGGNQLLSTLRSEGLSIENQRRIRVTLDLMFYLHKEQLRPDGLSYVTHPLLVAKVLVYKFGITDPNRIVAALMHDAPEDQAELVNQFFGQSQSGKDKKSAIRLLSENLGADPDKVRAHLTLLTNPDLIGMSLDLESALNDTTRKNPASEEAVELYRLSCYDPEKPLHEGLTQWDIFNRLYLGHIVEIDQESSETFTVKLADFFTNGFYLHLFEIKCQEEKNLAKQTIMVEKLANWTDKYAPVVEYIGYRLDNTETPLVSERGDRLLRKKVAFFQEWLSNRTAA